MLLQSRLFSPWNQNVQQDGEMAARIDSELIFQKAKLNDPFYNSKACLFLHFDCSYVDCSF